MDTVSSFIFACLVFALVNATIWFCTNDNKTAALDRIEVAVSPQPIDKTFIAWTTRDWLRRNPAPGIVLMGSSQMAAAVFDSEAAYLQQTIDCVEHRNVEQLSKPLSAISGYMVQVFNWSQSGAMISDDYLIVDNLFVPPHKPRIIVLGIAPRDFIDNTLPCAGSTEEFRFFARYADLNDYANKAFPDFMSRLGWSIDSLPLQTIKEVFKQRSRTLANKIPHSRALQNDDLIRVEPGKWCVSPDMPPYHDNTVEYLHRYKNPYPAGYKLQREFFDKYLGLMRDRHISAMVVVMPSLPANRALLPGNFWKEWLDYVTTKCSRYGAVCLNLSDSNKFDQKDYLDTVHLNANGGKKLLNILLFELKNNHEMIDKLTQEHSN